MGLPAVAFEYLCLRCGIQGLSLQEINSDEDAEWGESILAEEIFVCPSCGSLTETKLSKSK